MTPQQLIMLHTSQGEVCSIITFCVIEGVLCHNHVNSFSKLRNSKFEVPIKLGPLCTDVRVTIVRRRNIKCMFCSYCTYYLSNISGYLWNEQKIMLVFQLTLFSVYNDLFCLFLKNGNLSFDKFSVVHSKSKFTIPYFSLNNVIYIKRVQICAAGFNGII